MTRFPRRDQREEFQVSLFEISRACVLPGNFLSPRVSRRECDLRNFTSWNANGLPPGVDRRRRQHFRFHWNFFLDFSNTFFFRNEADEINLESWQSSNPPSRQSWVGGCPVKISEGMITVLQAM